MRWERPYLTFKIINQTSWKRVEMQMRWEREVGGCIGRGWELETGGDVDTMGTIKTTRKK